MRVVEYQKDTATLPYQLLKNVGKVAGVFSLIVCVLLIANNLSIKKTDPIHSPALQQLIDQLKTNPNDEVLREQVRELDMIARRAFFTSQHFNRLGIYLLVGGLVVMVVAFKSLEAFKTAPPFPDSSDPKDDIVENARWARKAVTAVGLVLVGFALMIALPWQSSLDIPPEIATPVPDTTEAPPAPEAVPETVTNAQPEAPAVSVSIPFVTEEQRLANWPFLLGPADNVSFAKGVPTSWDGETGEHIKWKTAIPLPGFNTPVYWEGKLYLTGADETARVIYCLDSESGEILWQTSADRAGGAPTEAVEVPDSAGHAAASMTTDGVRLFASFAVGDLVALDFDGKPLWSVYLGTPENSYGYASSLAAYQDTVLVQFDQDEAGFVAAYDAATGKERWKTARDFGASWSSPAVHHIGDHDEVILAADPTVVSYDPATGKELWRVDCLENGEVASIPAYADGIVYASADAAKLAAIDANTHEILWEGDDLKPGVCTPLIHEGLIYFGTDDGALACYDAKTGEEVWAEFADYGFYSSPILADGKIYLMDQGGNMFILKPGRTYELIAKPALGDDSSATPVIVGDSLYLRGAENLYRIAP
ncbi:MAG: PQQ-like beta-propeller repeat protein [Verrucomicrobiae bacterium]|nr:PQQ-like beta-propeller repeat protein [Verrucomicrobiae bacterium]